MPLLWKETIDTHRQAVREAALAATESLVAERGLRAVTMSAIAERTGIGRATLYKYFPDVESIAREWHRGRIDHHLSTLRAAAAQPDPSAALHAVLVAYAGIAAGRRRHSDAMAAALHGDPQVSDAHSAVMKLLTGLVAAAAKAGAVRADIPARELARFALAALAVAEQGGGASVERLVDLVESGFRPAR